MKTTVVGDYDDFASASRVAAELMMAGFVQSQISIVGRDTARDGARFAFAGALARDLAGAHERDFAQRLVSALARLCVPPHAATRHAESLAGGGGLVAIQSDHERARRAAAVMRRHGVAECYAAGSIALTRPGGVGARALAA
jgi:hypothetical protein